MKVSSPQSESPYQTIVIELENIHTKEHFACKILNLKKCVGSLILGERELYRSESASETEGMSECDSNGGLSFD